MYPMYNNQSLYNPMNPFVSSYSPMMNPQALQTLLMMNQQQQQLKAQMFSMMNMQQNNFNLIQNQLKMTSATSQLATFEPMTSLEISSTKSTCSPYQGGFSPELVKVESLVKMDKIVKQKPAKAIVNNTGKPAKVELEEMVRFLLDKIGKISKIELDEARETYSHNPKLLPVFDAIVAKYINVKKHREDIVRYIVRRAFKYLKTNTIKNRRAVGKKGYAILCKRYFQDHIDALEKSGVNIEDEKELIEFILPYRKNSKNRTMNINFTAEIFSSESFNKDYQQFLGQFEIILVKDNNAKINKLVQMAEECMRKGNADKIKNCTRLPWITLWVEKTLKMAEELVHSGLTIEDDQHKRLKTENMSESASNDQGMSLKEEEFSESS